MESYESLRPTPDNDSPIVNTHGRPFPIETQEKYSRLQDRELDIKGLDTPI
jgi:hypothetical protein